MFSPDTYKIMSTVFFKFIVLLANTQSFFIFKVIESISLDLVYAEIVILKTINLYANKW